MKIMTPMAVLKWHLSTFSKLIDNFDYPSETFQYRTSKSAYYPYKDRKKIHSDFLKVFFLDNSKNSDSFAFKFTFLNSEKDTVCEEQFFEITFRINNEIYSSKLYNIKEAKDILKNIIDNLKNNNFNENSFFSFLVDQYVEKENGNKNVISLFNDTFEQECKEYIFKYTQEVSNYNLVTKRLKAVENDLFQWRVNLEEQKEIKELKKRINKLESDIQIKLDKKKDEIQLQRLKNQKENSKKSVNSQFEEIRNKALQVNKESRIRVEDIDYLLQNLKSMKIVD